MEPGRSDIRSILTFWCIGAGLAIALILVWAAPQALLLMFAAALVGTSLRGVAEWVGRRCHCRATIGLALTLVAIVLVTAGAVVWIVPRVVAQVGELHGEIADAISVAREQLAAGGINVPDPDLQALAGYARHAAGLLATGAGLVGGVLFVAFLALYLALSPDLYRRGFVAIVPTRYRGTADACIGALSSTLRRWMVGRLVSMTVVGVLTATGLWLLGEPLPVTLGLFAAALDFVPNVGPLVSAVPALLLAAPLGIQHVLLVAGLYILVNILDGYVLSPWLQERAVSTPPALVIAGQVLFGALFGILGVMLATPLVASLLVVVRTVQEGGDHSQ
jgi:predicted PurR-regulated permease PerM